MRILAASRCCRKIGHLTNYAVAPSPVQLRVYANWAGPTQGDHSFQQVQRRVLKRNESWADVATVPAYPVALRSDCFEPFPDRRRTQVTLLPAHAGRKVLLIA